MQGMMSQYLEQSIASFLEHQDRIKEQMQTMMGVANPLTMMNSIADRNMAVWNMFKPPADGKAEKDSEVATKAPQDAKKPGKAPEKPVK